MTLQFFCSKLSSSAGGAKLIPYGSSFVMELRQLWTSFLMNALVIFQLEGSEKFSVTTRSALSDTIRNILLEIKAGNAITHNIIWSDYNSPNSLNEIVYKDFVDDILGGWTVFDKISVRIETSSKVPIFKKRQRSFTTFLLDSLESFEIIHSKILPNRFRLDGFFVFVYLQGLFKGHHRVFEMMWAIGCSNVISVFEDQSGDVEMQTFMPFHKGKCFDTSPVTFNKFKGGNFSGGLPGIFPPKLQNLHNCPVRVSTSSSSEPFVFAAFHENGSVHLSGRDIDLVTTLSEALNFKINFTYYGIEGYFYENGSAKGTLQQLLTGNADLAVADLWLKSNRLPYFSSTESYIAEHLVFLISSGDEYRSFEKFILPLNGGTWFMVIACFVIAMVVIRVINLRSRHCQTFVFGSGVRYPYLNVLIGFVGGNQKPVPRTNFARFLLMSFLLYSLVMRTVYQGSYYQLLRSSQHRTEPQTIDEMVDRGFTFYIFDYIADMYRGTEKVMSR